MIDPTVRRAAPSDTAALQALEQAARAGLVDTRGGNRWLDEHPEIGDGWPTVIDDRIVFVGTIAVDDDDVPIAYLIVGIRNDPMPIAHIDQVFVEPDARELGFGDEMLAAAMEWGRQHGAELIEGHALPGDRNIKNLYERAAITARLITVSRRL